jgi:hypothetical protein
VIWEIALRVAGVRYDCSFYQADPVLYTKFRPNAEGWEVKEGENFVRMNSFGMRDRERTLTPAPGTLRIALLGDSLEVGMQVPLEKTMAQVLENKLNTGFKTTGHSVEVLNFAQEGATLAQEYLMLRDRVWAFQPQIVILFVDSVANSNRRLFPSDSPFYVFDGVHLILDPDNRPPMDSSPAAIRRHAVIANLMNHYRLLLLLRKATQDGVSQELERLGRMDGSSQRSDYNPIDTWFRPPTTPEEEKAWRVTEGLLKLNIADAGQHGAEFWLASSGEEIEDNPNADVRETYFRAHNYRGTYAEDRFDSFAAREGIACIRLEPGLLQYAEEKRVSVRGFFNTGPNTGHWNEDGNWAVASIVADRLLAGSNVIRSLRAVPISMYVPGHAHGGE